MDRGKSRTLVDTTASRRPRRQRRRRSQLSWRRADGVNRHDDGDDRQRCNEHTHTTTLNTSMRTSAWLAEVVARHRVRVTVSCKRRYVLTRSRARSSGRSAVQLQQVCKLWWRWTSDGVMVARTMTSVQSFCSWLFQQLYTSTPNSKVWSLMRRLTY